MVWMVIFAALRSVPFLLSVPFLMNYAWYDDYQVRWYCTIVCCCLQSISLLFAYKAVSVGSDVPAHVGFHGYGVVFGGACCNDGGVNDEWCFIRH